MNRFPNSALPNLDFLRATAVLIVLGTHWADMADYGVYLNHFFGYHLGHTGVLMFFVHTCIVLLFSIERQDHGKWTSVVGAFFVRRFFRLYPLGLVGIFLVGVFHVPTELKNTFYPATQAELYTNILLIQNFFNKRSLLGPMWSLAFEVQMYLVLPILYYGLRRSRPQALQFAVLCWVIAFCIQVARLEVWFPVVGELRYFPCFLSGAVAYTLYLRGHGTWPFWGFPLLLYCICFTCPPYQPVPNYLSCLVLGVLIARFRECPYPWLNKITATVAKYSYSIYLLHFFVLYAFYVKLRIAAPLQFVGTAICLAVVCFLGYQCIEKPLLQYGVSLSRRILKDPPKAESIPD